jgi:threonine synthase
VPTGNFGDIFAGYVAKKMGLPIDKLIVATNENDILLNQTVKSIKCNQNTVQVTTKEVFEGKMKI